MERDGSISFFTASSNEWEIVKAGNRYAVCKFSNERMRLTASGELMVGSSLRTPENAIEAHWFETWEFATIMLKFCTRTQQIADWVGAPAMTLSAGGSINFAVSPVWSSWSCHLFGAKPGHGMCWRPVKGEEPNALWRWAQYMAFGNRWVKDGGSAV